MAWVDIQDGESMASVLAKINSLGADVAGGGTARYETTTGTVAVDADTWTQLPNDTLGARTNVDHLPDGVTSMIDAATGKLDPSELTEGDSILVQIEFDLVVLTNNTYAELRFQTEETDGAGGTVTVDHVIQLGDLNKGTGTYTFAPQHLFLATVESATVTVPVEIRCSKAATLQPSTVLIQVSR